MRANESIRRWEDSDKAGHPIHIGKLLRIEEITGPSRKPCKRYSFAIATDGRTSPHELQVLVQEEGARSTLVDFWEFGW